MKQQSQELHGNVSQAWIRRIFTQAVGEFVSPMQGHCSVIWSGH